MLDLESSELINSDSSESIKLIKSNSDSIKTKVDDTNASPLQFFKELIEAASAYNVNIIIDPTTYNEALNSPNRPN